MPISICWHNPYPTGFIHGLSSSCCTKLLSLWNTHTQHSPLVYHSKFQQTLLYFQQYWPKQSFQVASHLICISEINVFIPIVLGYFILEFYVCHPSNLHVNAINQCSWLQYHTLSKLQYPLLWWTSVKCSLAAVNSTKQQKDVVIFNGKITMGFVPCLLQVLWGYVT